MNKELIRTLDEFLARYFPATDELAGDIDDPGKAGWLIAEKVFRQAEAVTDHDTSK